MQITPHAGGGVNEAEQPYESPGGLLHRRFAIDRSGDCLVMVDCVIWRFDGANCRLVDRQSPMFEVLTLTA